MQATAPPAFRKTADTFPAGARTLPQRYFISPEIFAKEQERIFSSQWVLVGHQSQIAKAGDYFVHEVAGESLIVAHDQEATLRAFYNVCRHRGTRLCEEQSGHSPTIQCPYHAWTYALDGTLVGAPHMGQVKGFDKDEHSLHAINLALWEGFIFVHLAEQPTPLKELFAPLVGKFAHWNLPKLRSARELSMMSGQLEVDLRKSRGYHCPGVLRPWRN